MTRSAAVALMVAAPVLWSSAGVVARHIERAQPFEQVFWRSLFAFVFVFLVLLLQKASPWKAVRAGSGLAQWFALAIVSSLAIPLSSPAIRESYPVAAALVHGVCLFAGGAMIYSLALLLSTMFGDLWRPWLITPENPEDFIDALGRCFMQH